MTVTQLFYQIPAQLVADFAAGKVGLFGAVLKDMATGKVLAHVQQTVAAEGLIHKALGLAGGVSTASPLNLLATMASGSVTIFQNQQIKAQLSAVQQSLSLLQGMQMGGLLLSGLGLGVSVVGFAAMSARLSSISQAIGALDTKLDRVTQSRRDDELHAIMVRISTHLATVESLGQRNRSQDAAERAEECLREQAAQILHIAATAAGQPTNRAAASPAHILGLTSMYRLAHEASYRALLTIDEVAVAGGFASTAALALLDMSAGLSPDTMARDAVSDTKDAEAAIASRRAALAVAQATVADIRQTALMIMSHADLSEMLKVQQINGKAYLGSVSAPTDEALLMLPA